MIKSDKFNEFDEVDECNINTCRDKLKVKYPPSLIYNPGMRVVEDNFCHGFVLEDIDSHFKERNQIINLITYLPYEKNLHLFKYVNFTNSIQIRLSPDQDEFEFTQFKEAFDNEKKFAITKIEGDLFLLIPFSCKFAQKAISIDSDFILVRVSDIQSQETITWINSQITDTINNNHNINESITSNDDEYSHRINKLKKEIKEWEMKHKDSSRDCIEKEVTLEMTQEMEERKLKFKIIVKKLDDELRENELENDLIGKELINFNQENDHLITHVSKYRIPFPKLSQGKKKNRIHFNNLHVHKAENFHFAKREDPLLIKENDSNRLECLMMKCPICKIKDRDCVLHNCGHVPYCLECFEDEFRAYKTLRQGNRKKGTAIKIMIKEKFNCPICDKSNTNYSQIYFN